MIFSDCTPFVRQAVRGTLDSNKSGDIHNTLKTVDSRIFYIISGSGKITVGGCTYRLSPGSTVIFKAGTEYFWNEAEMQLYIINFDYSSLFSDIKETFHPFHSENFPEKLLMDCGEISDEPLLEFPVILNCASALEPIFKLMTTEYSIGGKYSGRFLSNAVKTLIYAILRLSQERSDGEREKSSPVVREIIEYIDENLPDDISNSTIAERFHFNASYINRVFKKHTGSTLHEYIISRRIDTAAEKLRSENISVSEIAKLTGFSGAVHFTKAFRKKMGMTPTDYRNM